MQNEKKSKRKIFYLLLAILVSVGFWIYVDEFGNNGGPRLVETTITDIPIRYIGENELADRGLMLMEEQTSTSVDLTFSGGRRLMSSLEPEDISITANLNNIERAGLQSLAYQINCLDSKFSNDMIQQRSISSAMVNISEFNRKTIDIRCELVGNVADGCSAGQVQLSQDTLEIRGQIEDIDAVSYVKITLDIGENVSESVTQDLSFQYFDAFDRLLSADGIYPAVETVQATLPVFVTKELKLVVDLVEAPGARVENLVYDITPSTIIVSGDASVLRNVDTITLGTFNLLDLRSSGTTAHTYPIIIPDGCQNLSGVTRATLDIDFKDMTSAQVVTQMFTYTNLPSGKDVEILTHELNVTIFGTTEAVSEITGEQISVKADLTNYSAASGTYMVPATVEIRTPGDVGIAGSYQVQVSIRERTDIPGTPPEDLPDQETEPIP